MSHLNDVNFTKEQLLKILDNTPVCINILNERAQSIYCNAHTLSLYGLNSMQDFNQKFYELSPQTQPDGRNSQLAFSEHVLTALENGETHFSWLDLKVTGEEIPLEISIYRLNTTDENGDQILLSSMRDLRPHLAGYDNATDSNEYYYSQITYRDLFNSVAELTEEWFWVYDVHMATIQFFGKGRSILGLSSEKQPFPSYVVDSGMVYPDDLETFLKFDNNLKTGVVDSVEVRFVQPSGIWRYYKITYKTMYDKDGNPIFTIGKTYDIDKQKRLEVLSKTDLLTSCLNKITTENVVKDILDTSPASCHALFIIDVDNFKSVNSELGHYFGDLALSDIAKNLHSNFRGEDIIGRIGGDEFLVFVKNIPNEQIIKEKAQSIVSAFKHSYSGENSDYKISGSIGIAIYPTHANNYEGLYKCADKALYNSKAAGKDCYTIYSDELINTSTKNLTALENTNKPINSYFDSNIVSVLFDIMYQANDIGTAMNRVVGITGTLMNADRCYIAQTMDNGHSYNITYEWTTDNLAPRKADFQNVPNESIRDYFLELEQNGVMCSNNKTVITDADLDMESSENLTHSYLLTQTKGKGHTRLIFGLDDSNRHRVWSEKEINTIQYVLKMVSIFIYSYNLEDGKD